MPQNDWEESLQFSLQRFQQPDSARVEAAIPIPLTMTKRTPRSLANKGQVTRYKCCCSAVCQGVAHLWGGMLVASVGEGDFGPHLADV